MTVHKQEETGISGGMENVLGYVEVEKLPGNQLDDPWLPCFQFIGISIGPFESN